ncbi:unnamed protein product [Eruca vesicaria subsp. sativa]|uniref:Transmembrane protein n=1 Tax=Eruca vesicaria subsp. sativa TaxID=29727 RepID=A0ABC8IRX7_ERUVS|nr:unnamed protein product [Eruca vesicaria subsp. sativa]
MKTIIGLGIGLSLVFGFLLLALIAEVYYLLRWKKHKKRVTSQESEEEKEEEQKQSGYAKELIQLFCFKRPQSLHANNGGREEGVTPRNHQDLELGLMKHLEGGGGGGELGFEAELMKLHNQRFLFTIMEETKADMESDDGKSRSRTRSLSDVNDCNTPGFTPLASPTAVKSSPLGSYSHHEFNPLFETEGELEFNKFFRSSSSPPPKFKFMRDAEEKLRRRMIEEAKRREQKPELSVEGSFLKFMNREKKQSNQESDETLSFRTSAGTKS